MSGKKPSCGVCGQRRCVQTTACVQQRTKGYVDNGDGTFTTHETVTPWPQPKRKPLGPNAQGLLLRALRGGL